MIQYLDAKLRSSTDIQAQSPNLESNKHTGGVTVSLGDEQMQSIEAVTDRNLPNSLRSSTVEVGGLPKVGITRNMI